MPKDILNKHYLYDPIAEQVLHGTYKPPSFNFSPSVLYYGVAAILYLIFIFKDLLENGLGFSVYAEAILLFLCVRGVGKELKK